MSRTLQKDITVLFRNQFEENCTKLLLESYEILKINQGVRELSENNITSQLVGIMKDIPQRLILNISINRESYLDSDEIYKGLKEANESSRIDIKYSTWNSNSEYEYFMEAKNLSENNWKRQNDNTSINANRLLLRYVETGINHFVNGKYPQGCLLGYVLEGKPKNIIKKINDYLISIGRDKEKLEKIKGYRYDSRYPVNSQLILKHYLLSFTN